MVTLAQLITAARGTNDPGLWAMYYRFMDQHQGKPWTLTSAVMRRFPKMRKQACQPDKREN